MRGFFTGYGEREESNSVFCDGNAEIQQEGHMTFSSAFSFPFCGIELLPS